MGMILTGDFDVYGNGHGNEASNKNAQTPKWEWGDGGGIMGLFLSSLLYIIEFIIGIVFGARILLSFIWDHDTLYTLHSWH